MFSVFNQTYKPDEVILINNNSTDTTQAVLEEWKLKYPDKIILLNEAQKGASNARNKGLLQAKNEWIQFLDADDELLNTKIENQVKTCKNLTETPDVVIGGCMIISEKITYERPLEKNDLWKGLIYSRLGITSSNLYKKDEVIRAGAWNNDSTSSQEYDLMFRLLKNNCKMVISQEPLTYIHVQTNSIHKSKQVDRFIEIMDNNINLRLKIKNYLKEINGNTREREIYVSHYIFTYLMNTTGKFPMFKYKSKIGKFISEKIKTSDLNLSSTFLITSYVNFLYKKIRPGLAFTQFINLNTGFKIKKTSYR